jgi:uncharacterized protein YoaH (UPF0181 family)
MEEHPSQAGEVPEPASGGDEGLAAAPAPEARPNPAAEALAAEAEEIRRLIDAGAGTPEAIKELAARLRAHREREESLWRSEVRPGLVKEGKGRLRVRGTGPSNLVDPTPVSLEPRSAGSQSLWLGVGLLVLVLVVVLAATVSVWLLVLPVVGLLAWAWYQGRDAAP